MRNPLFILAASAAIAAAGGAFAQAPATNGAGSLTVHGAPLAPTPAPLPANTPAPVRAASSADPLAGALAHDGGASPLLGGIGTGVTCCPCRTAVRHVVHHRRIVRRAAPPVVYAALPPPPVFYPVPVYRPFLVARPVVVYRPPVVFYRRPVLAYRPFYPVGAFYGRPYG